MKSLSVLILVIICYSVSAQDQGALYSVDRDSSDLVVINPTSGANGTTIPMTLVGLNINGSTGIALNPLTNELFVILRTSVAINATQKSNVDKPRLNGAVRGGGDARILGIVNTSNGVVTQVGDTGDSIAAISFAPDGTLYGVTGDGGNTSSTLFTINTSDGSLTMVLDLGNAGGDGEVMAYNPVDGLIYVIDSEEFFTVDPVTLAVTPIITLGVSGGISEATGIQFDSTTGGFLVADLGDDLFSVTTAGVEALLGPFGFQSKGIAFSAPPPRIPTISTWGVLLLAFGLILLVYTRRNQILNK